MDTQKHDKVAFTPEPAPQRNATRRMLFCALKTWTNVC